MTSPSGTVVTTGRNALMMQGTVSATRPAGSSDGMALNTSATAGRQGLGMGGRIGGFVATVAVMASIAAVVQLSVTGRYRRGRRYRHGGSGAVAGGVTPAGAAATGTGRIAYMRRMVGNMSSCRGTGSCNSKGLRAMTGNAGSTTIATDGGRRSGIGVGAAVGESNVDAIG